jgi:diadenosine tetraphosphate (Ap4A) HIT family hydrolase
MEHCVFCEESKSPSGYVREYLGPRWPFENRILFCDELAYCVPGYSPQVYPYFLVIPRRHVFNVCQMTRAEWASVYNNIRFLSRFRKTYDETLQIFEHGGCGAMSNACVDHCHLHIISDRVKILSRFREEHQTEEVRLLDSADFCNGRRYLWLGRFVDPGSIVAHLAKDQPAPSQYFRRKISETLGDELWDWALGINMEYMEAMMRERKTFGDNGSTESAGGHAS